MKKLIKSYNFWTALAGSIGLLAVSIGKIFGYEIAATGVEEAIMAVCGILVVLGIVKKPTKQTQESKENQVIENENIDINENGDDTTNPNNNI